MKKLRTDLLAATEDRAMWKEMQRETKEKLAKLRFGWWKKKNAHKTGRYLAERNASDRDATNWKLHCEEVKRREGLAKESVESVSREMSVVRVNLFSTRDLFSRSWKIQVLKEKGPKVFLATLHQRFPPRGNVSRPLDDDIDKAAKYSQLCYHPDKQDVLLHGIEWCLLCVSFTQMINSFRK